MYTCRGRLLFTGNEIQHLGHSRSAFLLVLSRIAEENAITRERVLHTIHGDFTDEFVSLECARIVEEVIR